MPGRMRALRQLKTQGFRLTRVIAKLFLQLNQLIYRIRKENPIAEQ